ncbi:MAG: alpha/beta hydrolase [Acidimicrobiia bacterium]
MATTTASSVLGADTQELSEHARVLDHQATELLRIAATLNTKALALTWRGSDRTRFEHDWNRRHQPSLASASRLLGHLAATVRQHAAEQEAASAARTLSGSVGDSYLLYSEHGDGREARVYGNLADATHVAILVPGMNTEHNGIDGSANKLFAELRRDAKPGEQVAVVTGLVYDTPEGISGASTSDAYAGRAGLRSLVADVHALNPGAEVSVVAHSYGTTLTGATMKTGSGLDVERVVAVGSPGMTVDTRADLKSPTVEVFAGAPTSDPVQYLPAAGDAAVKSVPYVGVAVRVAEETKNIPLVGGIAANLFGGIQESLFGSDSFNGPSNLGFGVEPTDSSFGAHVFDTGDATGHSQYFSDPGSVSNIARIVLGHPPTG